MRAFGSAIALLFASPAYAQTDEARAACFTELPLTAALVAETNHYGYGALSGARTVVIGNLSPTRYADDAGETFGSVLFIRDSAGAWRAMLPRTGESVVAAYANDNGGVILATMWMSEGPGGSWMLMRSSDSLATAACSDISFPDTLNQPVYNMEYLDLHDLDINARGRGEIIGVSRTEGVADRWFVYRTRDHGATWSAPQSISRERNARSGGYVKIDQDQAPAALVAELSAYAATR